MKSNAKLIISWLLLASMTTACTNRDRELAKRTGDGSDTFKFTAPDRAPAVPPTQQKTPPANDGSDTFHYKPDRRGLATPPKSGGK